MLLAWLQHSLPVGSGSHERHIMHLRSVKPQVGTSQDCSTHMALQVSPCQAPPWICDECLTEFPTVRCRGMNPQRRSWLASRGEDSTGQLPHRHIRPDLPPRHHPCCVGGDAALSNRSLPADGQHSLQAQSSDLRGLAGGSTVWASGSQLPVSMQVLLVDREGPLSAAYTGQELHFFAHFQPSSP